MKISVRAAKRQGMSKGIFGISELIGLERIGPNIETALFSEEMARQVLARQGDRLQSVLMAVIIYGMNCRRIAAHDDFDGRTGKNPGVRIQIST